MRLITAASVPHMTDRERRRLISRVHDQCTSSLFDKHPSIYDQVDHDTRILLIGSSINVGGEEWLRTHPRQARWLAEQGISGDECLSRYKSWLKSRV